MKQYTTLKKTLASALTRDLLGDNDSGYVPSPGRPERKSTMLSVSIDIPGSKAPSAPDLSKKWKPLPNIPAWAQQKISIADRKRGWVAGAKFADTIIEQMMAKYIEYWIFTLLQKTTLTDPKKKELSELATDIFQKLIAPYQFINSTQLTLVPFQKKLLEKFSSLFKSLLSEEDIYTLTNALTNKNFIINFLPNSESRSTDQLIDETLPINPSTSSTYENLIFGIEADHIRQYEDAVETHTAMLTFSILINLIANQEHPYRTVVAHASNKCTDRSLSFKDAKDHAETMVPLLTSTQPNITDTLRFLLRPNHRTPKEYCSLESTLNFKKIKPYSYTLHVAEGIYWMTHFEKKISSAKNIEQTQDIFFCCIEAIWKSDSGYASLQTFLQLAGTYMGSKVLNDIISSK